MEIELFLTYKIRYFYNDLVLRNGDIILMTKYRRIGRQPTGKTTLSPYNP